MGIKCLKCNNNIDEGVYLNNQCCISTLRDHYGQVFQKDKRDILAKALSGRYKIIDPFFDDLLASHFICKEADPGKPYLAVDINPSIIENIESGLILLSDFAHYLSRLGDDFLRYKGYIIRDSHIIFIFDFPENGRSYLEILPEGNDISSANRILSKALRAISQSAIVMPDQMIAFEILNPKRIITTPDQSVLFLFPLINRKFLQYAQYDDLSYQLNIFEKFMEINPSFTRNRNNLLEIFNIGWNLYHIITGKPPEFDRIIESKDSFPLRPSKINGECTDYLEEIVLRSLFYPNGIPFSNISEIYSFLSKIYKFRTKARATLDNTDALIMLARYYEEVSQLSPKKNRWIGLAYDIYQNLSKREPENLDYIYQKANIMFKTKKYTYAKSLVKTVLSKDPDNVQAILLLGYIYLDGFGDFENSMLSYERAESILQKTPTAILMLKGDILFRMGNLKEARDVFMHIAESKDTNPVLIKRAKHRLSNIFS